MMEVPEGWKLVPIEPTIDMLKAGCDAAYGWPTHFDQRSTYRAMLEKTPEYFIPTKAIFLGIAAENKSEK